MKCSKASRIWLAELGLAAFPWRIDGFRVECANETADMQALSTSDVEALQWAHDLVASRMRFDSRAAASARDWQAANLGVMRYEDMIDDGPDKAARVAQLRETAPYLKL